MTLHTLSTAPGSAPDACEEPFAFMMSAALISPPGPEPATVARSTPSSWASRRAFGDAGARPIWGGSGAAARAVSVEAGGGGSFGARTTASRVLDAARLRLD